MAEDLRDCSFCPVWDSARALYREFPSESAGKCNTLVTARYRSLLRSDDKEWAMFSLCRSSRESRAPTRMHATVSPPPISRRASAQPPAKKRKPSLEAVSTTLGGTPGDAISPAVSAGHDCLLIPHPPSSLEFFRLLLPPLPPFSPCHSGPAFAASESSTEPDITRHPNEERSGNQLQAPSLSPKRWRARQEGVWSLRGGWWGISHPRRRRCWLGRGHEPNRHSNKQRLGLPQPSRKLPGGRCHEWRRHGCRGPVSSLAC